MRRQRRRRCRGSAPASAAHSVTSQTAGQFNLHLKGNGEATFTAPNPAGRVCLLLHVAPVREIPARS